MFLFDAVSLSGFNRFASDARVRVDDCGMEVSRFDVRAEERAVTLTISGFYPAGEEYFARYEEQIDLYAHRMQDVRQALREAGATHVCAVDLEQLSPVQAGEEEKSHVLLMLAARDPVLDTVLAAVPELFATQGVDRADTKQKGMPARLIFVD